MLIDYLKKKIIQYHEYNTKAETLYNELKDYQANGSGQTHITASNIINTIKEIKSKLSKKNVSIMQIKTKLKIKESLLKTKDNELKTKTYQLNDKEKIIKKKDEDIKIIKEKLINLNSNLNNKIKTLDKIYLETKSLNSI